MDQIELLLVFAQIGVGLAGFASLATVVGQAYTKTDPEVNAIRLRGLLHVSISVMILSLIAVALLRFAALSEEAAWRIASAIGFITAVVVGIGVLQRDRARRRLPGYHKFSMVTNFTILGIVVVALPLAASGAAGAYVGTVFVGAIILMLVGGSTAFMLVVTSFLDLAPRREDPPR